jgi:hypothetical protein
MAKQTAYNNIAGLNRALRSLPKLAHAELRTASGVIASDIAAEAAGMAQRVGGVARYVAPTIKARRGDKPAVQMGGTALLPGRGGRANNANQRIGNVMWGAEFGGQRRDTTQQFQPWRGNKRGAGYFLWPTVRINSDDIMERYSEALLRAMREIH